MQTNSPQADTVNPSVQSEALKNNQFHINDVPAESGLLVGDAAVFNVAGHFCATQAKCPHKQGPLNEGKLDGSTVTCPWPALSSTCARASYCRARRSPHSKCTASLWKVKLDG